MADYAAQDKRSWQPGDRVVIADEHLAWELNFWFGIVEAIDFVYGYVHVRHVDDVYQIAFPDVRRDDVAHDKYETDLLQWGGVDEQGE